MKLLVDGVEIPWPKKIELQVDDAGETMGPLYLEFIGGQLVVEGNAEHEAALTLTGSDMLPDGSYRKEFLILRQRDWSPEMGRRVWDGDKLVPLEDLPKPDAVAGGERSLNHDRIAQILGSEHRVLSRDESSNLVQALHSGGKAAMLTEEQLREIEAMSERLTWLRQQPLRDPGVAEDLLNTSMWLATRNLQLLAMVRELQGQLQILTNQTLASQLDKLSLAPGLAAKIKEKLRRPFLQEDSTHD